MLPYMEAFLPRSAASIRRSETNKAKGIKPRPSRHATYLNLAAFEAFIAERLRKPEPTNEDIASYLELGTSTVFAARKGNPINGPFVGALLKRIRGTDYRFEDLAVEGEPVKAAA